MSVILAVCGENFCAMASDGRMVEEPAKAGSPNILTEELPKLRKVNRNVCVGFAGDTLAAVRIVNALDEYDVQYLTFEKILKILRDRAQEVEALPLGVRFLVGGRGRKGGFQMATLGSDTGYEPDIRPAQPGAYLIEGAIPRSVRCWNSTCGAVWKTGAPWTTWRLPWMPASRLPQSVTRPSTPRATAS